MAGNKQSREQRRTKRRQPPPARALEVTLAGLAHDIRTPLTGILALSELLVTSELGERERGWATAIKSTAEHLALLTSLIVDAARAEVKGLILRPTLFQPKQFVDTLGASLAARCSAKGLAWGVKIAPDLPQAVVGDAMRLRGALENLIDNAVKFTDRGSVHLGAKWERSRRGRGRLLFTVTDSGIGLDTSQIRRLFRPFAQANTEIARRFGGAGLGLAYAKRIARAMDGDLAVTSRRGKGSKFKLSVAVDLPGARGNAHGSDPRASAQSSERSLHILCVEDNPFGRVVLNTLLTELGHRADFVGSGEAAIEAVAVGAYDAVLMDVTLAGIDGIEATRRIRALPGKASRLPIICISGRSSAEEEASVRAAGADDYLPKPLGASALTSVLHPISAGHR
jgi:CheY-like chemotaxis protein